MENLILASFVLTGIIYAAMFVYIIHRHRQRSRQKHRITDYFKPVVREPAPRLLSVSDS
jgi:hypothetical protein